MSPGGPRSPFTPERWEVFSLGYTIIGFGYKGDIAVKL